jgi:type IV pilus assembly protein PilO
MNDLIDRLFSQTFQIRLAIYAGALLLLSALYYNFIYSPAAAVVAEKTTRVEELRAQRDKKTRMANQLERLREEVKELNARLSEAIAQLPSQKEIPDLLSTVSSVGRESGLEITVFRQKPENLQDFYAEVPVEMVMKGMYVQVTEFFKKVGALSRIVNVKDISMKNATVGNDRVTIDTSCTAVTFRFLTDEERARIAAEKAKQQK